VIPPLWEALLRDYAVKYWWLAILANLIVGVSLALPLFLPFRETSKIPQNRRRNA
jgi:hypothetical protein